MLARGLWQEGRSDDKGPAPESICVRCREQNVAAVCRPRAHQRDHDLRRVQPQRPASKPADGHEVIKQLLKGNARGAMKLQPHNRE